MKLRDLLKMVDVEDYIEIVVVDVGIDAIHSYKGTAGDCTDEELLSMNATDIAAIKDVLLIFVERGER